MENEELMEIEKNKEIELSKWDEVEDTLPQRSLRKLAEDLLENYHLYNEIFHHPEKYTMEEKTKIEKDFSRDVRLLQKADEALDFVKNSTACVMPRNGENQFISETATLFKTPKDYAKAIVTLTCGFNEQFANALDIVAPSFKEKAGDNYSECFEEIFYDNYEYAQNLPQVKTEIDKLLPYEAELTVKDLEKTIDDIAAMREELGMSPKYSVLVETNLKLQEQIQNGTENYFERSYISLENEKTIVNKDEEQKNDNIEIVESNDGEVMNVSANARAQENTSAYDAKVEQGNKVVHNEAPRETTNSLADVKGNVKFEQAKDVGSKEMAEINSGNGTDQDIETAIKSGHSELRSQSDRNSDNYEK